jgi:hypothetical protein
MYPRPLSYVLFRAPRVGCCAGSSSGEGSLGSEGGVTVAVNNVSMELREGEVVCLVGACPPSARCCTCAHVYVCERSQATWVVVALAPHTFTVRVCACLCVFPVRSQRRWEVHAGEPDHGRCCANVGVGPCGRL